MRVCVCVCIFPPEPQNILSAPHCTVPIHSVYRQEHESHGPLAKSSLQGCWEILSLAGWPCAQLKLRLWGGSPTMAAPYISSRKGHQLTDVSCLDFLRPHVQPSQGLTWRHSSSYHQHPLRTSGKHRVWCPEGTGSQISFCSSTCLLPAPAFTTCVCNSNRYSSGAWLHDGLWAVLGSRPVFGVALNKMWVLESQVTSSLWVAVSSSVKRGW